MANSNAASASRFSPVAQVLGLVIALVICLGAGGLGAMVTTPEIGGWYRTLTKPSWNPPDAVFGPVWTTLYVLMAISAWLVWRRDGLKEGALPLGLFAVQLVLNTAWSWIFFGLHQPGWAFVENVTLWLSIAATIGVFYPRSRLAAGLLFPYLAWVSFAVFLNYTIWQLNATSSPDRTVAAAVQSSADREWPHAR